MVNMGFKGPELSLELRESFVEVFQRLISPTSLERKERVQQAEWMLALLKGIQILDSPDLIHKEGERIYSEILHIYSGSRDPEQIRQLIPLLAQTITHLAQAGSLHSQNSNLARIIPSTTSFLSYLSPK